jgi:hypothetical protein
MWKYMLQDLEQRKNIQLINLKHAFSGGLCKYGMCVMMFLFTWLDSMDMFFFDT